MESETVCVSSYSRKQAIEDGFLKEVPKSIATRMGFNYPLVVTQAIWADCISGHNVIGRFCEILRMLFLAIRNEKDSDLILFNCKFGDETVELKALCHAGDDCEPVITIQFPNED